MVIQLQSTSPWLVQSPLMFDLADCMAGVRGLGWVNILSWFSIGVNQCSLVLYSYSSCFSPGSVQYSKVYVRSSICQCFSPALVHCSLSEHSLVFLLFWQYPQMCMYQIRKWNVVYSFLLLRSFSADMNWLKYTDPIWSEFVHHWYQLC